MDEYTRPDYHSIALITIDVQNDFSLPGSPLEIKGTMAVIPHIVEILGFFRRAAKPIFQIIRLYKEDGSNADLCRRKWIESGNSAGRPATDGAELVNELKPNNNRLDAVRLLKGDVQELTSNEFVLYKPRWGAFYGTSLEQQLRKKGINTLVFTGCNFPNCPRTSIYEATERDFKVVVIEDAVSRIYDKGLAELRNIGCEILTTRNFIDKLSESLE
jgi:nicotinamidase-related amidase